MRAVVCSRQGDATVLEYVADEPIPEISEPDEVFVCFSMTSIILLNLTQSGPNSLLRCKSEYEADSLLSQSVVIRFSSRFSPVDYKIREGTIPRRIRILGFDFAGIVEKSGDVAAQASFVPGTRVFGNRLVFGSNRPPGGTYAELCVCNIQELAVVPEDLPLSVASSVPLVAETTWQMFLKAGISERGQLSGRSCLVVGGSGGTGSWALLLARHYFQAELIFAVGSTRNSDYMKGLGAHVVIDYRTQDFVSVITAAKKEQGEDFPHLHLVLDCVGGRNVSNRCCSLLHSRDFFITIAGRAESVPILLFHKPWKRFCHAFGKGPSWYWIRVRSNGAHLAQIVGAIGSQRIVDSVCLTQFSLEEIREAHDLIESRRTVGKIVLKIVDQGEIPMQPKSGGEAERVGAEEAVTVVVDHESEIVLDSFPAGARRAIFVGGEKASDVGDDVFVLQRRWIDTGSEFEIPVSLENCFSRDGIHSDVSLVLHPSETEIKAHKCILAARSPGLRALLFEQPDSREIHVDGFLHKSVEAYVRFLYTADLDLQELGGEVDEVFRLAQKWGHLDDLRILAKGHFRLGFLLSVIQTLKVELNGLYEDRGSLFSDLEVIFCLEDPSEST